MPNSKEPRQDQEKEQGSEAVDLSDLNEEEASQVRGGVGGRMHLEDVSLGVTANPTIQGDQLSQKVRPK